MSATIRKTPPITREQAVKWAKRKLYNREHKLGPHHGIIVTFYSVVVKVWSEDECNEDGYRNFVQTAHWNEATHKWEHYTGQGTDHVIALVALRETFPWLF